MRFFKFLIGSAFSFLLLSVTVAAQTQPSPLTVRLQPVVSGLSSPLLATNAKDGSKRLFIVQRGGIIKVVQPGANTATDFMNITTRVLSGGERGLLGLAFHPQFATNGYFFVNYTRQTDGATVIARFKTTNSTNALGDPASERIVLTIPQPFSNHNGGMIEFRTDNGTHNLYIGMGDGGSANDPGNRAQNINDLLGKFLRITPDVSGNNTVPAYTNPPDNPYAGATPGADEIYAIGLRNPFRWSFDRGGTNQLWAGDVGQGAREEVSLITLGGNFGWRIMEGTICTPGVNPSCTPPAGHLPPVFEYPRTSPRCSVTGGYVYRGGLGTFPSGTYLYGDYCSGEVLMWNGAQQLPVLTIGTFDLSSFGEDEDGELYVCGLSTGTVRKLVRAKASADFDGDFKTDFSVFRPSNGIWYRLNSSNNSFAATAFGTSGDIPVPGDYDGDNITDIAVFRPSNGTWYFIRSSDNTFGGQAFGNNMDTPVAGDYDGDGRADFAVSRAGAEPSSPRIFYILQSSDGAFRAQQWGLTGTDRPVRGDFDGDGKSDIAVYSESGGYWYVLQSSNGSFRADQFGAGNFQDEPIPADYDGDGKTDKAVFRRSNGVWYILQSLTNTVHNLQFGLGTDIPSPGDYDGDGKADIGVFRPSNGNWFFIRSSNNVIGGIQFGQNGDLPVPPYARQ